MNDSTSDPLLGLSNEDFDSNFDGFMHSLGDQGDSLLTEDTLKKITEILTPEQQKILEEKTGFIRGTHSQDQQQCQPCFLDEEHAQNDHAAGIRPCDGGTGEASLATREPGSLSVQSKQTMQKEDASTNPRILKTSSSIQEGIQKIKEQLDKGGKLVAPLADSGPAVVTEFIGDNGDGFGAELEETSKCSIDSMGNSSVKEKETESPVRRSSRKTVRLFEITGPKRGRKKDIVEETNADEPRQLRSADDSSKSSKETQNKSQSPRKRKSQADKSKENNKSEEKGNISTRRSQRKQKTDDEKDSDDGKSKKNNHDGKETGKIGRPKKSVENEKEEKAKPISNKTIKGKSGNKTEDEADQTKSVKKKLPGKRSFYKTKKESDGQCKEKGIKKKSKEKPEKKKEHSKNELKKSPKKRSSVKGKKEEADKEDAEKEEHSSEDEDSDSSDQSVPDDGELSDDGSEFDPDEDPDRPWCICRKPHGNRFMICCDTCEDWFHGDCVGVTQTDGKELEKRGEEWMCPKCKRKLHVLAKEVKEKERQERIKNREKSEGSSDESVTSQMRQKLLKALEKELASDKHAKHLKIEKDDHHSSESDDLEEEIEEVEEEHDTTVKEEEGEVKEKVKKKIKMKKEDREAKEAKKLEKELEWKRQLKEMKERAKKAEIAAKRRDSVEGQMMFEKIGNQKVSKQPEIKFAKQESAEKKQVEIKKEVMKEKVAEVLHDRRKSDSSLKDKERKRAVDVTVRVSVDSPKEKVAKTDNGQAVKKVRITPTPKTSKPSTPLKFCIVCNKPAMRNAVYCSKECIVSYTKESLRLLSEDKQKRLGPKSPEVKSPSSKEASKGTTISPATSTTDDDDKNERITVVERSTKKVIAGLMAPTRAKIFKWVEEHPTFEVFRQSTPKTGWLLSSSFYASGKKEKIQIATANPVNTSLKEKKDLTEVVRNNVKKSLKETILARCREVEMAVNIDEVAKICSTIEDEIVKMYGDTGQKYKTKYRSLIFNLKDPKNRSLYKQVVQGELPPAKLVHMSPEQLASAELAKWREMEAKHNIEMIKKREEEDALALKHAVKKTHKGEIEMEHEGEEDMQNLQTHIEAAEEYKEAAMEEGDNVITLEDTTEQHTTHLFDLNCKICTGKQQPAGEKQPILPHVSTSVIQAVPESSMPSPTYSPEENDLRQNSPDLIESMNRSPIHIPLPSKEKSDPLWKGFVMMQHVAKFATNAYRISGPCDNLLKLLPDTIQVCGRIKHEQVWDYLFQLKSTTHKTIDVLRFEMSAEDDKKDYVSLYTYFYTRKKIGVVENCHSTVKDMYIVPIASHDPVPPELQPFDGPGMPDPRPHMLIGIIVRSKQATPMKRPKSSHHEPSEHIAKKSKKKHKRKKEEKQKFEDIVFGKQRGASNLEDTPSESGSSHTPSYTPDIMSPPSSVQSSATTTVASGNTEGNNLLEERLEKQKEELLKLQAEIRAQISENKALGIPTPTPTLVETSTVAAPSSLPSESPFVTPVTAQTVPSLSASVAPLVVETPMQIGESIPSISSIPSEVSTDISVPYNAAPAAFATRHNLLPSVSTPASNTNAYRPPSQFPPGTALSSASNAGQGTLGPASSVQLHSVAEPPRVAGVSVGETLRKEPVVTPFVGEKEATDKAIDADEPYDPEDELDTALELDSKEGKAKSVPGGDEPYDPEDDFVLDLIEDISLPTSLKKIDKPNLPFPLEMPKKQESKMPELPPIKLPEKITDRRAASLSSSSTLTDPRAGASPRNQVVLSHVGTPNTQSPSARSQSSLTSPSSASSHVTSPTSHKMWDPRQPPPSVQDKPEQSYQYHSGTTESVASDNRRPASQWPTDRSEDQSYATYSQYQTGDTSGHGHSREPHGENYSQRRWQGGQNQYDATWQGREYDTGRSGDYRNWEGGEQGHTRWRGEYYSGHQYNYDHDNSGHQRPYSQDHSNQSNYYGRDRDYDRSWEGRGNNRGYYRTNPRGRGRDNQWR